MSTHDYVIDNQSAVAFRADLNAALAAIVTQNSSATAPTVTFANMIWYDTSTNILKKRNEANSAWINLGTIDETAGTFTPSGERALATQAQAEAGTNNTALMTPLRTAQAVAALTPTPTTAQILAANAGASVGAVGTYAYLLLNTNTDTDYAAGSTLAGSSLRYAGTSSNTSGTIVETAYSGTPAGTWRIMGYMQNISNAGGGSTQRQAATVCLRIS